MLVIRNKMPPTARRERAGKSRMARTKKEKEKKNKKNITAVTFLFLLIFIFIYSDLYLRTLTWSRKGHHHRTYGVKKSAIEKYHLLFMPHNLLKQFHAFLIISVLITVQHFGKLVVLRRVILTHHHSQASKWASGAVWRPLISFSWPKHPHLHLVPIMQLLAFLGYLFSPHPV